MDKNMPNRAPLVSVELTKNDAKCSDVMTALKPTTGTNAANNVPKTTCIAKDMRLSVIIETFCTPLCHNYMSIIRLPKAKAFPHFL